MTARSRVGLAFALVNDLGFAVGLVTHQIRGLGDLIWVAEPIFDDEPDLATVESIKDWRWPVFFPLGAALRRDLVSAIGQVEVPPQLRDLPRMRGGNRQLGWREVSFASGSEELVGVTTDRTLPISQIVNDTRLKEMLVSNWGPEHEW